MVDSARVENHESTPEFWIIPRQTPGIMDNDRVDVTQYELSGIEWQLKQKNESLRDASHRPKSLHAKNPVGFGAYFAS